MDAHCEGAVSPTALPPEHSEDGGLNLPIDKGYVTITIDNQDLHLLLDTASPHLIVMDGHWHESKFGVETCKASANAGCFYCPKDDPCDFEKEPNVYRTVYYDGLAVDSIIRYGSLTLGGHKVDAFPFRVSRLVLSASTASSPPRLKGFFGVSGLPPTSTSFSWDRDVRSLLDALVHSSAITRPVYSIRAHSQACVGSMLITGDFMLGDTNENALMASKARGSFHFVADKEYHEALPTVQISSLRLSGADGFLREYPVSLTSPLDTGSTALFLPIPSILNDIAEALSRNLRRRGYFDHEILETFEITDRGTLGVYGAVVDYLPVLSFDLGDHKRSMRVQLHPREYCHCSLAYCRVAIRRQARRASQENLASSGHSAPVVNRARGGTGG
ncbi:hypothetical protein FOL46_006340 [Perkinsus olseni]|uniref:Peptidase A1 domain-containing protein n=1 Tax=Perkinsus olseni TaxID=32597 RepID=A0A7J6LL99_PEROL|nr:hypothetical protein FOL46_006340 [Perkinsus olseni]